MPEEGNQFNRRFIEKENNRCSNEILPLISVVLFVMYMTWIGYLHFLNIQITFYDFSSWQSIFYSNRYFIFMLPVIWGTFLWMLFIYINDLLTTSTSTRIWKTLTYLVLTNQFKILKWFLVMCGSLLPFVFFYLKSFINSNILSAPLFPYASIFLIIVIMFFFIKGIYRIQKKNLCSITRKDIRFYRFFYAYFIQVMIPFIMIVSLIIVPDAMGKLWGISKIHSALYNEPKNIIHVNISPEVCWKNHNHFEVVFFMELKDEIVYMQKNISTKEKVGFFKFFFNYLKNDNHSYSLCTVSLPQIKIDGSIKEYLQNISP